MIKLNKTTSVDEDNYVVLINDPKSWELILKKHNITNEDVDTVKKAIIDYHLKSIGKAARVSKKKFPDNTSTLTSVFPENSPFQQRSSVIVFPPDEKSPNCRIMTDNMAGTIDEKQISNFKRIINKAYL